MKKPKICIAPLDWGLGHATRCISLAKALMQLDYQIFIASEGYHEVILREALPAATFLPLPGYRIRYSKTSKGLIPKIITQIPKIIFSIYYEHFWLRKMHKQFKFDCIISDNRFGFYHPSIKSIFITHQLNLQTPFNWSNHLVRIWQYSFINKFSAVWIPDIQEEKNYAGILSNPVKKPAIPIWYMGALARLSRKEHTNPINKYTFLGLVSGPEPQRTLLENALWIQGNSKDIHFAVVAGRPLQQNLPQYSKKGVLYPHANGDDLADLIASSEYIIFRGGYTSLMELIPFQKKLIIIPTPGQTEQVYLAKYWSDNGWAISFDQSEFNLALALEKASTTNFTQPAFLPFSIELLNEKMKALNI